MSDIKIPQVHKDMVVADIVSLFPEAAEVMMAYGLHCVGCHANAFETLEQGILGHGYDEGVLQSLVDELNEYVDELNESGGDPKVLPKAADEIAITVTDIALEKIAGIAADEEKVNKPLRVDVRSAGGKYKYAMNFVEESDIGEFDKSFTFDKQVLVVDKRDYKKLNGLEIDYLVEEDREGFKMNNPNV